MRRWAVPESVRRAVCGRSGRFLLAWLVPRVVVVTGLPLRSLRADRR
jgi:hypothetical protein